MEKEKCKYCGKEMKWIAGGQRSLNPDLTYTKAQCECGAEFTIEKSWTTKIDRILMKTVRDRTEEEHILLAKYFGGMRKYFLTMGEFKNVEV